MSKYASKLNRKKEKYCNRLDRNFSLPDMKGGGGGMNGGTFMKGDESGGCIKSGGMPATPGFPNV